jgi:hypothetical protein
VGSGARRRRDRKPDEHDQQPQHSGDPEARHRRETIGRRPEKPHFRGVVCQAPAVLTRGRDRAGAGEPELRRR